MGNKIIFVFLDGVGMGQGGEQNPFCAASMPFLSSLLGGPLLHDSEIQDKNLSLKGIDACLDISGIPQSATGQTALFTGINASKELGYHFPAFPNEPLVEMLHKDSILKQVSQLGFRATFANAYTPQYFQLVKEGKRRHSASTHSVLAAELPFRYIKDLMEGNAVYWDMTNQRIPPEYREQVVEISPYLAGQRLVQIAQSHELVLYECFLPDLIGHRRHHKKAVDFLVQLDLFLKGIWDERTEDISVVVTSDHGNIEDLSTGEHTLNKVPLLCFGNFAPYQNSINNLTHIAPSIISLLAS